MDVLLLDMATVKRVYMDKLTDAQYVGTKDQNNVQMMNLTWAAKEGESLSKQKLKTFSVVNTRLFYDGKDFDFQAVILRP